MGGFFCSADIFLSTLHCSTQWQTKMEPQSILYSAWKAKTKRSISYKETACVHLLQGIATENEEERARFGLFPPTYF